MFKKIKLMLLVTSLCGAAIYSCSKLSPVAPHPQFDAAITASINKPDDSFRASALDSMVLRITGENIHPIDTLLYVDGVKAQMSLQVPGGDSLHFTIIGYKDSTQVLRGDTTMTPKVGKQNPLHIKLNYLVSTIITTPPDTVVYKNDQIKVQLQAREVDDLGTFGAEVYYNPQSLRVIGLERDDTFLKKNSGSVMQMAFTDDPQAGKVKIVLGIFPASAAVSGSGAVAKLIFQAIQADTTELMIKIDNQLNSDLGMFNSSADLIYSLGLGSRICIQDTTSAE